MCTLTVLPGAWLAPGEPCPGAAAGSRLERLGTRGAASDPAFRVVFSRDERRARTPGRPPARRRLGRRTVLMPFDPDGGGTWIAANDAGVVVALLNATAHVSPGDTSQAPVQPVRASRGLLVPAIASARDGTEAWRRLLLVDPSPFAPFRLVYIAGDERGEAWWNGSTLRVRRAPLEWPWLRTSSSLGDARVVGPRRALFDSWFARGPVPRAMQDEFHRHRWTDHPELSVWMSRPDACTVSITTVEVGRRGVVMRYVPLFGATQSKTRNAKRGTNEEGRVRNAEVTRNQLRSERLPHSAFPLPR